MRTTTIKHTQAARRGLASRSLVQGRSGLSQVKQARKTTRRGFAAMDPKLQRRIARQGGLTISRNRKHMAQIGRVGGGRSHKG